MRRLFVAAALLGSGGAALAAPPADVLRVCADPENPPFSASDGGPHGAWVEVAEVLGARLGMRVQYTWWLTMYGRRAVRNTLLADTCDAYVGLPMDRGFLGKQVALTKPYLRVGYALVTPKDRPARQLQDLRGRKIAIAYNTPPQQFLAGQEGYEAVTYRSNEEALDGLHRREADAAFVWGPIAGWMNRTKLGDGYQVVPQAGEGMQFQVTIGVRPANEDLRRKLDEAIGASSSQIDAVARKYGFPVDDPVALPKGGITPDNTFAIRPLPWLLAQAPAPTSDAAPAAGATQVAAMPANAYHGNAEAISEGKSLFNQHCSHCHSPNAQSPVLPRDLRRLKMRYGEKMSHVAWTTIRGGRSDKGMPSWDGVIDVDTTLKIISWLETVQREP